MQQAQAEQIHKLISKAIAKDCSRDEHDAALAKALEISGRMAVVESGGDARKSIHQLMREVKDTQHLMNKPYLHKETDEPYQALMLAFDEQSNEGLVIYCLSTIPALKFIKPVSSFLDRFEEGQWPRNGNYPNR